MSIFSMRSSAVEIYDNEVDRRDAVFSSLLLIFRQIAAKQKAAMNLRVESFHATAEHFRPAGEFGNVADREAGFT